MNIHCKYDELVKCSTLKPHPKNRNKHPDDQIERLAKILKYQGIRAPIVVSKRSGKITKGHGTLQAIKKNGWQEAPVVYQDFEDDDQEWLFVQSDNAIAMWAELDLKGINADLSELGPFDIDLIGIKDFEVEPLDRLLGDEDAVPDVKPTDIKLGDLFVLGDHRLLCGDSTDAAQVERLMNGEKPMLMFTDPPYGVDYNATWRDEAAKKGFIRFGVSKNVGKIKNDNLVDWTQSYKNFDCQIVYVWHAGKFSSTIQSNLESCNYDIISQIIWVKPTFAISRGDYHWQHEPCWYAVKKGKNHNWQGKRDQATVWKINRDTEIHGHATPKPVELCEKGILNSTKISELVCDPFGGSGSTLIACEKTNRKCFMMELDPQYCQVIIDRWEQYTGKKAVKDASGKTT